MKKNYFIILLILIIINATLEARNLQSDKNMDLSIQNTNTELPKQIDSITTWYSMSRKNDILIYQYIVSGTYNNINVNEYLKDSEFLHNYKQSSENFIINKYCSYPDTRKLINNGYTLKQQFFKKNGIYLFEINIDRNICLSKGL